MKNLLLVIDLQEGWRHKSATEDAMLRAVELCKDFDGDAIHCCFRNDPNSLFVTQLNWERFMDEADTAVIPEFAPQAVPQFWRSTYSCLTEEVLAVAKEYDRVFIAGVFTDISVLATAMDLFDHGVSVSVVSDCVATLHGEQVHAMALRALEMAIGDNHVLAATDVPQR
ncbi:MAG TPA: isochorismatase family protein [Candidatus Saccharimonadales bacterium]